jgi:hypothetical protein
MSTAADCLSGAAEVMGQFDALSDIAPVAGGMGCGLGLMNDVRKLCKPQNFNTMEGQLEFVGNCMNAMNSASEFSEAMGALM